jgi:hypothetical protein
MEEDESKHNRQPQQERYHPILIVSMQDQGGNPPAGKETSNKEVGKDSMMAVQKPQLATPTRTAIIFTRRNYSTLHLLMITVIRRRHVSLFDAMVVKRALRRNDSRVCGGSSCVGRIIVLAIGVDTRGMMEVLVVMLMLGLERGIRVATELVVGAVGSRMGS